MTSNTDENGIRYGVLYMQSVDPEQLDGSGWTDNILEGHIAEVKKSLRLALEEYTSDNDLDSAVDDAWEAIEDAVLENFEGDGGAMDCTYDDARYHIEWDEFTLTVTRSPYVTLCRLCSPCFPNAGDLQTPSEDGEMAYCLGPEWFNQWNECPYKVYTLQSDGSLEEVQDGE